MKRIRLLAALLSLCLVCSAVLTACGTGEDNPTDTAASLSEDETKVDPRSTLDLPDDLNFGGYNFSVLYIDEDSLYTMFDVPGLNAEPVNDAIYERNRVIENRFGVKFSCAKDSYDGTYGMMQKQVKSGTSGEDAYDLIMQICRYAYSLTLNGMLCDYSTLEYVDMDKEYYFDSVNKQFSIAGKTFFAYGADSLNVLGQANCLLFNRTIADKRGMPDLYEKVKNMDWTFADMFKCCTDAAEDVNGDGRIKLGKEDIMGLVGRADYSIPNSWIPAGGSLIAKDEEDMPYYAAEGDERMTSAMQDMLSFMSNGCCDVAGNMTLTDYFIKGNAFMECGGVLHLQDCKEMTDDFGVLPWPMYDKTQGEYHSRLIDGWINCVPANCEDPVRTSAIMQALAYYSYGTVYDAYYKTGLQAKYIRDPESVDMIKLILNTLTIDLGDTVWYFSMRSPMTGQLSGTKGPGIVTSVLKKMAGIAKGEIKNVTKFVEKNPG